MFWTHETDSMNKFCELTTERRCKDPWPQFLLEKDLSDERHTVIGNDLAQH